MFYLYQIWIVVLLEKYENNQFFLNKIDSFTIHMCLAGKNGYYKTNLVCITTIYKFFLVAFFSICRLNPFSAKK